MSAVAIPFKDEDPGLVLANLKVAASHDRVERVWAIGESSLVAPGVEGIAAAGGTIVEVVPDRRIGSFRPGKGDAMNTALLKAVEEGVDRLHFYDADITNFDHDWIEGAETAADFGYEAVRHTFSRAATDAMITWFVTKPMFAMKYPGTALPSIGQPLGGELMLVGEAIETVASSAGVMERSDWGIDTVLTHAMVANGLPLYEHHVAAGKSHSLYGSLAELKTMLVECLDAAIRLPETKLAEIEHHRDPDSPAPAELRAQTGYSVEMTQPLLSDPLVPGEAELIEALPRPLPEKIHRMAATGDVGFVDEEVWWQVLVAACGGFSLGDRAWESLVFRLWTGRVLHYTTKHAARGYEPALDYLAETIAAYESLARRDGGPVH